MESRGAPPARPIRQAHGYHPNLPIRKYASPVLRRGVTHILQQCHVTVMSVRLAKKYESTENVGLESAGLCLIIIIIIILFVQ